MAHIHTAPGQHDHVVSAYIVRLDGPEPRIILHRHKKFNKFMQFGGHIELDETPWQAITHELMEESGYAFSQLQLLQPKDRIRSLAKSTLHPLPLCVNTHELPDKHFHTDSDYAFITHEEPKHKIGQGESNDIRLLTRQELVDLPDEQTFEDVRQICLYVLDNCVPNWEVVSPSTYK